MLNCNCLDSKNKKKCCTLDDECEKVDKDII